MQHADTPLCLVPGPSTSLSQILEHQPHASDMVTLSAVSGVVNVSCLSLWVFRHGLDMSHERRHIKKNPKRCWSLAARLQISEVDQLRFLAPALHVLVPGNQVDQFRVSEGAQPFIRGLLHVSS